MRFYCWEQLNVLGRVMTKRNAVWLCFLVAISTVATCRAQTVEQPRVTLSIGTFYIGFLPVPVAEARGLFNAEGLDVTVQNFGASGAKALQALVGGSTDVVVGGVDHT